MLCTYGCGGGSDFSLLLFMCLVFVQRFVSASQTVFKTPFVLTIAKKTLLLGDWAFYLKRLGRFI